MAGFQHRVSMRDGNQCWSEVLMYSRCVEVMTFALATSLLPTPLICQECLRLICHCSFWRIMRLAVSVSPEAEHSLWSSRQGSVLAAGESRGEGGLLSWCFLRPLFRSSWHVSSRCGSHKHQSFLKVLSAFSKLKQLRAVVCA